MTVHVKAAGAWRTVSQPHFKLAGAWKSGLVMHARAGWPERYAQELIPAASLIPALWKPPSYASGIEPTQPAPVEEASAVRLTWSIREGYKGLQGPTCLIKALTTTTVTITCSDAPAGVPWQACIENGSTRTVYGNEVIGPGTSTVQYVNDINGDYNRPIGVFVGQAASGTSGHLVTSITATNPNTVSPGANDFVPFPWKQVWPQPGTGTLRIYGVRKEFVPEGTYVYPETIKFNNGQHYFNGTWQLPLVPFYRVMGDTSQIASAKVTLTFTPVAPKSPVEHTISWEAPVGWALYHIGYMGSDGYTKYYYAALTDAEAATERAKSNRYVTKLWSPKEGGWFVYMPVCWDASGVTVPMRAEEHQVANSGLDIHSGYTPFPPNRTATSALADYTVSNGYSDMMSSNVGYTAITIELKNSGGTVLTSWTGSLPNTRFMDEPGKKYAVTPPAQREQPGPAEEFYWPQEWRGMFDRIGIMNPAYTVRWGRDIPNKGEGEWDVFDIEGAKVGDFRLAMRYGFPGQIEIRGVNLASDLVGQQIMRHIVEHGVEYCPTDYVIIKPPDPATKAVMQSWGWREMTELSALSMVALPLEYQENLGACLWMWSDPMYNRFRELELPSWQEVSR